MSCALLWGGGVFLVCLLLWVIGLTDVMRIVVEGGISSMPALWVIGLTDVMRIVVEGGISSMPALWVIGLIDVMRTVAEGGGVFLVCLLCG